MRTSTVVFLVIFLCLFSSSEKRSKIRSVFDHLKAGIHEVTSHDSQCDDSRSSSSRSRRVQDSDEVRSLRSDLRGLEQRDEVAKKTLRTIDRSIRALDERIRKLEQELARNPQFDDLFKRSLELLLRQRIELHNEREEIASLQERMRGESIRIQTAIDLAKIRGERREVESFLQRERRSPVEAIASEQGY